MSFDDRTGIRHCHSFLSDLHFLELRQALEGSGGLQHGEVVVVETPATTVTESRNEEDGAKTSLAKSRFGLCVFVQ